MGAGHVRNRTIAAGVVLLAASALAAAPAAGQAPATSLPPPSAIPTPLDPDAVVLIGTITGSNTGPDGRHFETSYSAQATMDVILNLAFDRATATGMAEIAGEYSGDCQFSDSGTAPIDWDSNPSAPASFVPSEGRPAFASVQVFTGDPRYPERPLTGIYLSVGAGLGGEGGTCGHVTGGVYDITDVDFPLRIDVLGCNFFEVLNNDNGSWSGSCEEQDANGIQTQVWTAEFAEAYSPPE